MKENHIELWIAMEMFSMWSSLHLVIFDDGPLFHICKFEWSEPSPLHQLLRNGNLKIGVDFLNFKFFLRWSYELYGLLGPNIYEYNIFMQRWGSLHSNLHRWNNGTSSTMTKCNLDHIETYFMAAHNSMRLYVINKFHKTNN
jgi:hypothetical protein